MTREPMPEHELEATLADLGERLAYPRPTRLGDAVRARLRDPRTRRWWHVLRSPRYAFMPLIATLTVLALVVVLAVPDARAAASEFLRLRGIDIFRAPAVATPAGTAVPRATFAGSLTTLDEARRRADFTVRAPTDPRLGAPDEVYRGLSPTGLRDVITLVYTGRAGIPVVAGVSAASSLAADLAAELGMTLIGFVRAESFVTYAGSGRIGSG